MYNFKWLAISRDNEAYWQEIERIQAEELANTKLKISSLEAKIKLLINELESARNEASDKISKLESALAEAKLAKEEVVLEVYQLNELIEKNWRNFELKEAASNEKIENINAKLQKLEDEKLQANRLISDIKRQLENEENTKMKIIELEDHCNNLEADKLESDQLVRHLEQLAQSSELAENAAKRQFEEAEKRHEIETDELMKKIERIMEAKKLVDVRNAEFMKEADNLRDRALNEVRSLRSRLIDAENETKEWMKKAEFASAVAEHQQRNSYNKSLHDSTASQETSEIKAQELEVRIKKLSEELEVLTQVFPNVWRYRRAGQSLLKAARYGDDAKVKKLLESTNIRIRETRDENGNTPLLLAAFNGHAAVIEILLAFGAAVEATNDDGDNALLLAADRGYVNTVKAILNHGGINTGSRDKNSNTALMRAAAKGHTKTVSFLISKYANYTVSEAEAVATLGLAQQFGRNDIANVLESRGYSYRRQTVK